jgi:hypothetical protein
MIDKEFTLFDWEVITIALAELAHVDNEEYSKDIIERATQLYLEFLGDSYLFEKELHRDDT